MAAVSFRRQPPVGVRQTGRRRRLVLVSYVTVFVFTLLLEPQINPIKHFPVVTVCHKLLFTAGPLIVGQLSPYLGAARANTIVWSTIWLIPGVFGFLVWELKENWRLYASNRPRHLRPVPIGRHGEPLLRLLRLGIHSGTVPRLFSRLRHAGRHVAQTGKWRVVHKQLDGLRNVEESLRSFVDRELLTLLAESHAWRGVRLTVAGIHLATNQILAEIGHPGAGQEPVQLAFQERAGWILVSLARRGWLDAVPRGPTRDFPAGGARLVPSGRRRFGRGASHRAIRAECDLV